MRMETALASLLVATLATLATLATGAARAGAINGETPPGGAATSGEPASAGATTFESLARSATVTADVGTLVGALIDKCPEADSVVERARCRASQSYLRRTLPEQSFSISVDDPAAISVSAYDPSSKGYRVGLAGCVACTTPIPIGRTAQPSLITLKKPGVPAAGAAGDSLAAAVEIATTTLAFASEEDAARWLREVRPRLRAKLIFKPAANEWRFRASPVTTSRGYAMDLVAGRITDPCTGAVLLSSPPSLGEAERLASAACGTVAPAAAASKSEGDDVSDGQLPPELSRTVIAGAMARIRGEIFACFQRNQAPGAAPLTYEVAGSGQVQAVRLAGPFSGTPTGDCMLNAARNARFPRFDAPIQTFTYPFFLRH